MLVEAGARGDWAAASQWIRGFTIIGDFSRHGFRLVRLVLLVRRALVAFCLVGWYSFVAMEYTAVLVAAHLPGREPINLGVLVLDEGTDRLHLRFRTDFDGIEPLDEEVIHGVPEMIESMALEMGALGVLQYLEDRASNAIRLGDRATIRADNATEAVDRAFAAHVA